MADAAQDRVLLGRVQGLFGVRGWIKLYSYATPPENIFTYSHWHLCCDGQWQRLRVVAGRVQGKSLVAQLANSDGPVTDRDVAALWLGADIAVLRSELPQLAPGEYYGAQLIGFQVITQDNAELGLLADFMETGAHPVMVVRGEREHLIPFVRDIYIMRVDTRDRRIVVDWDPHALDD